MRTLVIGDIHLDDKLPGQLRSQIGCLHSIVIDESPDEIIFLGDIFMHRNPSPKILVELKFFLDALEGDLKVVHLLRGNHDSANKSDDGLTALQVYNSKYIHVHTQPQIWRGMYFIPHYENEDTIKHYLGNCHPDAMVFGHFGYRGCLNSFGDADSTLVLSDFTNRSILGHIHRFKQDGNVTTLGTPYTTNFGEAGSKGYYMVIEEDEVGQKTEEFKEVTFGPRHVALTLGEVKDQVEYLNDASWLTFLRIVLAPNESVSDIPEELHVAYVDIKVGSSFKDGEDISKYKPKRDLFTINDQVIEDYVDGCDISESLTKEDLMSTYYMLKSGEGVPDE